MADAFTDAFNNQDVEALREALMNECEFKSESELLSLVAGLFETVADEAAGRPMAPRGRFSATAQASGVDDREGVQASGEVQWRKILRGAFCEDAALAMEYALLQAYETEHFQGELKDLLNSYEDPFSAPSAQLTPEARAYEINMLRLREVDRIILPQFGFSPSTQGQADMRRAVMAHFGNEDVARLNEQLQDSLSSSASNADAVVSSGTDVVER